jgi:hypothetical protein
MPMKKFDIAMLNKIMLVSVFKNARDFYLTGNPWDCRPSVIVNKNGGAYISGQHERDLNLKNSYTCGFSFFYRTGKAFLRMPSFHSITDENCQQVLVDFLNGSGNKDLASLKYMVVSLLLENQVGSDVAAVKMVDQFTQNITARVRRVLPSVAI